jgi:hypothetical protein
MQLEVTLNAVNPITAALNGIARGQDVRDGLE